MEGEKITISIRTSLLFVALASVLIVIGRMFPQAALFGSLFLLLLIPLSFYSIVQGVLYAIGVTGSPDIFALRPGLSGSADNPSFKQGTIAFVTSNLILIGLWPVLLGVGAFLAFWSTQPLAAWSAADWSLWTNNLAETQFTKWSSLQYWLIQWSWALISVARWWFFFLMLLALLIVTGVAKRVDDENEWRNLLPRFLYFAPWLIVLEVLFLIFVWIDDPSVAGPTGDVVGIFSWELWHWDCWMDRTWLIRLTIPTILVGYVFFDYVARIRGTFAILLAIVVLPAAIWLSVASVVAYRIYVLPSLI